MYFIDLFLYILCDIYMIYKPSCMRLWSLLVDVESALSQEGKVKIQIFSYNLLNTNSFKVCY